MITALPVAAQTIVPQSSLTPSGQYYTDVAGGGIGNVVVTTGGGNSPGIGNPSGRNDDGFAGPISFGYSFSLFGKSYDSFYANNNGNISFGAGISAYIPEGLTGARAPVISPFFADVDTRGAQSGVLHLRSDANQTILTWDNVGYFQAHDDKLDSFQLVVRGPNYAVPQGEGTIGFFYKDLPWISTDTSVTAAAGFGDGSGAFEAIEGSNTDTINGPLANHYVWFDQNLAPVTPVDPTPPPVTPVPEPETYALMLAGLAISTVVIRRRRQGMDNI